VVIRAIFLGHGFRNDLDFGHVTALGHRELQLAAEVR
jgi:hypothetical protein